MAVAVEGAQHWRIFVGQEAEPDGLWLAERLAECCELRRRPARLLALDRLAEHAVGLQ
jgi:hypothetical protein